MRNPIHISRRVSAPHLPLYEEKLEILPIHAPITLGILSRLARRSVGNERLDILTINPAITVEIADAPRNRARSISAQIRPAPAPLDLLNPLGYSYTVWSD